MSRQHTAWPMQTSTIYSTTDDPFVTNHNISLENASLSQGEDGAYFRTMDQRSFKELKALIHKIRQPLGPKSMQYGHVYAATTPWRRQSMVKIGYSGDHVGERLRSISKKCRLPIFQVFISRKFRGAYRVEQLVHKFLQGDCHIRFNCKCGKKNKEWFKVRLDVIMNLVGTLRLWMQRQPYDFNTGLLKPEWSAALASLERSLSTQNPYTILDFLVYSPITRLSFPLNLSNTVSAPSYRKHSAPNTSSPVRCSRRTRGHDNSSHQKEMSSSLDRRRSAGETRLRTRSSSTGAINQPIKRLNAREDTQAPSYLSQIIWWLHAVLIWAMSYKLEQPCEVRHIPGQWELDFDQINLNDSEPPETRNPPPVQDQTSGRGPVARARAASDTRPLPAKPPSISTRRPTSLPSGGYPEQLWQPLYGINFSPSVFRPGLPSTLETLPHRVLRA